MDWKRGWSFVSFYKIDATGNDFATIYRENLVRRIYKSSFPYEALTERAIDMFN